MELWRKYFLALLLLFRYMSFFISGTQAAKHRPSNNTVSSVFVFGDSTVDPGNNNYLNTAFRSNFPPYGKDFVNHMPTGRFTNGRLTTDFVASYVGIKDYVPPYLDSTLTVEDLMTGVSFASAGSGLDPLTARISNVVDMTKQLDYFKEYKRRIQSAIGKQRMENHIKKAGFVVSTGTNDFVVNYFTVPIRRKTYSVSAYQQFVLQTAKQFIQSLREQGARTIAVVGLPPMGCLPAVITLFSNNAILERGCIENLNSVARDYNQMLENEVRKINMANLGARLFYVDIYTPMADMIQGHGKADFDEVSHGCCGSGYLEAGFLCNPKSYVCPDASKYVFWDSIHPTEKTYHNIFNAFRSVLDDFF